MKKLILLLGLATFGFANYATVTKVIDGDTVYFKKAGKEIKCRIAYIDTPEKSRNKKAKRDVNDCPGVSLDTMVKAGKVSKQYAVGSFPVGSKHNINLIGKDRYGRSICEIGNYNKSIVLDGYALPYIKYIPKDKRREYIIAAKKAKSERAGLWNTHPSVMNCLNK